MDSEEVQELMDSYNQDLTMKDFIQMHGQEQGIKDLGSLDPVQSEDQMTKPLRDFLDLVRLAARSHVIRQSQRKTCYTDFISKDVHATAKGAVHTLVNEIQSVTRVQRQVRTK
ncbi:hypothetical protein TNCV_1372471 [Trichonephila clavipes]|nr:hypothetical protein TNCV_1372471 [Trichonephila clavipes]